MEFLLYSGDGTSIDAKWPCLTQTYDGIIFTFGETHPNDVRSPMLRVHEVTPKKLFGQAVVVERHAGDRLHLLHLSCKWNDPDWQIPEAKKIAFMATTMADIVVVPERAIGPFCEHVLPFISNTCDKLKLSLCRPVKMIFCRGDADRAYAPQRQSLTTYLQCRKDMTLLSDASHFEAAVNLQLRDKGTVTDSGASAPPYVPRRYILKAAFRIFEALLRDSKMWASQFVSSVANEISIKERVSTRCIRNTVDAHKAPPIDYHETVDLESIHVYTDEVMCGTRYVNNHSPSHEELVEMYIQWQRCGRYMASIARQQIDPVLDDHRNLLELINHSFRTCWLKLGELFPGGARHRPDNRAGTFQPPPAAETTKPPTVVPSNATTEALTAAPPNPQSSERTEETPTPFAEAKVPSQTGDSEQPEASRQVDSPLQPADPPGSTEAPAQPDVPQTTEPSKSPDLTPSPTSLAPEASQPVQPAEDLPSSEKSETVEAAQAAGTESCSSPLEEAGEITEEHPADISPPTAESPATADSPPTTTESPPTGSTESAPTAATESAPTAATESAPTAATESPPTTATESAPTAATESPPTATESPPTTATDFPPTADSPPTTESPPINISAPTAVTPPTSGIAPVEVPVTTAASEVPNVTGSATQPADSAQSDKSAPRAEKLEVVDTSEETKRAVPPAQSTERSERSVSKPDTDKVIKTETSGEAAVHPPQTVGPADLNGSGGTDSHKDVNLVGNSGASGGVRETTGPAISIGEGAEASKAPETIPSWSGDSREARPTTPPLDVGFPRSCKVHRHSMPWARRGSEAEQKNNENDSSGDWQKVDVEPKQKNDIETKDGKKVKSMAQRLPPNDPRKR